MRIIVAAPSPVPLRAGGAERLLAGLVSALTAAGHTVDTVKLPVREHTLGDLVAGYEAFERLDLSHADVVITGKYPAWMVDHPGHVVWMLHPLRGLYDTYPAAAVEDRRPADGPGIDRLVGLFRADPDTVDTAEVYDAVFALEQRLGAGAPELQIPSPLAVQVVHLLDAVALGPRRVRRHAAISATVADRPGYFPAGTRPLVLHPPLDPAVLAAAGNGAAATADGDDGHDGDGAPPGGRFLAVSRLEEPKRLDLVIEAFRRTDGPAELVIAGDGPQRERLEALADGDPRIRLVGAVPDGELARLYDSARAVVFVPRDEDYGYVALEAMAHGRPVVTARDAGGPVELVDDGRNGRVVDAEAGALAAALEELSAAPDVADALGSEGRRRAGALTWEAVVDGLLAPPRRARRSGRPHVVAVSTYPLHPLRSGGQLRGFHLLDQLCRVAGTTAQAVTTTVTGSTVTRRALTDAVSEITVPLSGRHHQAETDLRLTAGPTSITDIAVSLMWRATPALARELHAALDRADAVVLVQPYLAPAVAELAPELPTVCDEHNVETTLKASILPGSEGGRWLLEQVERVERHAVQEAELVTAVTEDDLGVLHRRFGAPDDPELVVPNGVDTGAIAFVTGTERRQRAGHLRQQLGLPADVTLLALFVGSGHLPNIEAGRTILELAASMPRVGFVSAGRHCEGLAGHRVPANVRLLGDVDPQRLDELLAGCDVALNPMAGGGGSNLKLLTYLAAGLPVVSTVVGARGIDADEAGLVVAGLGELDDALGGLGRQDLAARARAGRRWAEEHADWARIGRRFAELVQARVLA